jgi:hypothetical protein
MTKVPVILFCFVWYFAIGCNSPNDTPANFKYHDTISRSQHKQNSEELKDSIKVLIREKQGPFYPKEYDSLTEIFVDTILYSPNNRKYASFIITKNSNDKLLDRGSKNEFHYNAFCFIGKLTSESKIGDLTWVNAQILVRFETYTEVSNLIRHAYFREITTRTNLAGESTFKYNFDDIRFWDGPVWKKYYK